MKIKNQSNHALRVISMSAKLEDVKETSSEGVN